MSRQEDISFNPALNHFNVAGEKRRGKVEQLTDNVTGEYDNEPPNFQTVVDLFRIRNPLVGVPRETLMRSAEKLAADHDLNEILPLLKKGALAAQNPAEVDNMDEFTIEEKEIFREEITYKWRQPKILYITIILNSVAGM
jgi:hypothetical protein